MASKKLPKKESLSAAERLEKYAKILRENKIQYHGGGSSSGDDDVDVGNGDLAGIGSDEEVDRALENYK